MSNKLFAKAVCGLLAGVLLLCVTGCEKKQEEPSSSEEGKNVTVIQGQAQENGLTEGTFDVSGEKGSIRSNARKLGGSSTLDIEFPEDETQPDEEEVPVTEPQWLPGIW